MKTLFKLIGAIALAVIITMVWDVFFTDHGSQTTKAEVITPNAPVETKPDYSNIQIVTTSSKTDQFASYTYVTAKNNSNRLCKVVTFEIVYYNASTHAVEGTGYGTGLNIPAGGTKVITCMASAIKARCQYDTQIQTVLFQ